MTKVAASILSADFANLHKDCTRLLEAGADVMHFDVMDGHFVPNISYGAPVLTCLHAALPDVFYDVHLMISDPARYAADFAKAGADLITFHLEAVPDTVEEVIAAIRATGCQVGISIRPGTPVEAVFPYLGVVDLILVMSVEPGFGGQKFLPTTPTRIAAIRAERTRLGCNTLIEVDGGINTVTGPQCIEAGVDWLVAGNSLFRAEDPAAVVRVLHSK
ncbi:ribulose-phosphate 3-epimerase [Gemmiger sp.]|jgi:ribulose-phosphate 3-epimerase|uniref:ribulose-phosphate 3-epimerase n=1 Tax=Gemmiger sp. TaxID=2049027 RepID=UPI002F93BED2